MQAKCETLTAEAQKAKTNATASRKRKTREKALLTFVDRLSEVTVLDPACGSGNFLYVALHLLLDLEKEVITHAARSGVSMFPQVRPTQLAGIEINEYAQELASVVIWIGYLQWMHHNGFNPPSSPVLEPIESIHRMDAILDLSDPQHPKEPEWPKAEFIVGNPPFLGNRLMSRHFDKEYISGLSALYEQRLGGRPDICCYWFEKARDAIKRTWTERAGLLATQGIRGGSNRNVLKRIIADGDIFFAVSDREWILDGANVHVSIVGFDNGNEKNRVLDGNAVDSIYSNLTSAADITKAKRLIGNQSIGFQGAIKRGKFDLTDQEALQLLKSAGNPNGCPNSDVIIPYVNGVDVTRRYRNVWVVEFPPDTNMEIACQYQGPYEAIQKRVYPARVNAKQTAAREYWWLHWCPRPELESASMGLDRVLVTPRVTKHRLFAWRAPPAHLDAQLIVFARSDDYFIGVLHSRIHEVWARSQGTQLRERESGFRYTPTTCFETFPFPEATDVQREEIDAVAKELDRRRNNWLNPPEWVRTEVLEFQGSTDGQWKRFVCDSNEKGIGTVRYPRLIPRDEECAKFLTKRTLTNLYNDRPTWLELAHKRLDKAVFAAYGWDTSMSDDDLLAELLNLNLQRGAVS